MRRVATANEMVQKNLVYQESAPLLDPFVKGDVFREERLLRSAWVGNGAS